MNDDLHLLLAIFIGFLIGCIFGAILMSHVYDGCFPKYCPECGSNYRSSYEYCSADGTLLKDRGNV